MIKSPKYNKQIIRQNKMVVKLLGKIFGTRNDKIVKQYTKKVKNINDLESKYESLSDNELKDKFESLKLRFAEGTSLDKLLFESFAMTREASKRVLNMRHFDVQLIGGMVLHDGAIAEMKTGEGKTLVATLAVVLNAIEGKGVHVVTVNDYLATRDAKEMEPLYNFFGFSVGIITGNIDDDQLRKAQYATDITYGTNNEYGFDYLRDNMKYTIDDVAQLNHNFVIVDEVDSILIDEARTPLIISGPANRQMEHYHKANQVSLQLKIDEHFTVDEKNKVVLITEDGIAQAEKLFEVDNIYSIENSVLAHQLDQSLKANYLFTKDVDYVLKDGEVIIVDEFTGRLSEGRRFSEGLHQALEAKEGVIVQEETQTLADITFQNYFRLYNKLAGMTGTAQTEATEFDEIYSLGVVSIPTNVPVMRKDSNDLIYKSEKEKFDAVIKDIKKLNSTGQPILVGTASIEKSEYLSTLLKSSKIVHTVLNAKQHEKEAHVIEKAGKKGAVTIATNMAGRGVDIKIDDEINSLGGLAIIGTERHESRRIDNQLRGRSGRQGDNGASRFYLSLEDNLIRIFQGDRIKTIMEKLGIDEGESIESSMVTRAVENAQKKVEGMHFESRKHLLEYDDVANEQRKTIYTFRRELLSETYDIDSKIDEIRDEYIQTLFANCDIYDGTPKEDFNIQKLSLTLKEDVHIDFGDELEDLEIDALLTTIKEYLAKSYNEHFAKADEIQRKEISRVIYLQVLDSAWREHLYQMDILKTGISLRGYNQKDPLVEYKKESYNLFIELVQRIKIEAIKTLQISELQDRDEEERIKEMLAQAEAQMRDDMVEGHELKQPVKVEKKIARNEPCPCGSGKKYKQCCGKSGPKKGALAQ
jgi:preprotein translocase subunit SecA